MPTVAEVRKALVAAAGFVAVAAAFLTSVSDALGVAASALSAYGVYRVPNA